ncbi:MAG: alpha/beta hydrolase [Candidatus Thiodiazotropha sp. (ex Lucinoma borealis)]|nr:alpha/beta hydrolase [Candidatus Thiodiazotropha sp. (ex Lucinoma borealis)]MCU7868427.1 alpha/beta hydrolase [Candidatus Thiodiazotropha sp. (ex Lucinoma borealis)]
MQDTPLFPEIEAYHQEDFPVSDGHTIHFKIFGHPQGVPVLFLHGGPGSGCNPQHARLFHPKRYQLIQVDQRGAGHSRPQGCLLGNNLSALVNDLIQLRHHIGIKEWLIYGGSWGATLALEYAKQEHEWISGLLLRAPFLARSEDLSWFTDTSGVANKLPAAYAKLRHDLGLMAKGSVINRLYQILCNGQSDNELLYKTALAWDSWEAAVMGVPVPIYETEMQLRVARIDRKRIHVHYCKHGFFLGDQGVLPGLNALRHLKVSILHAVGDQVCRYSGSETLSSALADCELKSIDHTDHSLDSAKMQLEMQRLLDALTSD